MWLLNHDLYKYNQPELQEKFQDFLSDYASKVDKTTKEQWQYIPEKNGVEHNMGIEFPGFNIHNMLDVMIEDFL